MERIYVTVRPRPLSPEDAKTSPWRISANSISCTNHSTKFEFDHVFGEDCNNVEVYEARTKEIVSAAVRGFNGTVFAYGQTNSGKTHTMRGSVVEPGVIPLAVRDLFNMLQEDADREFLLRMSYMEIYNEEINDLLAPEHRKLQIHEGLERGIFVAGLREEIVATPEQVIDFMNFGESHRHIGETNMNVYSSRSHTIFRMIIESRERTEEGDVGSSCDAVRVSVLNLVDLAGSERAAKTGAEGVRLKEGSHINKSLMTLGTVIKKLSEGAESQGSHVPYRDSKLTRILQPSLGGNANTAIICNITLAQIHWDETKSSLQFASRALRVTNFARVNEILTDAALLKRQKKEIEDLRARLQGSHSEHSEDEILNLRNTLLQSELERERITLELQEEKKALAFRERRIQEQAKKIESLSSIVLSSNADDKHVNYKKDKRRDTWCSGAILRETLSKASPKTHWKLSISEPVRPERDMGLPLPFEQLLNENQEGKGNISLYNSLLPDKSNANLSEICVIPNARSLLNVTNRKKGPKKNKKKNLVVSNGLEEMHAEYDDLLLEIETQGIIKEVEIACLMKKLAEAEYLLDGTNTSLSSDQLSASKLYGDRGLTLRELEAIFVIKHLQEQVELLEEEKLSIQQDLDNVIDLATNQNISAREQYEELQVELDICKHYKTLPEEMPFVASKGTTKEDNIDVAMELLTEVHGIVLEVQCSRGSCASIFYIVQELFQSVSDISTVFLDLKTLMHESSLQLKCTTSDRKKICSHMRKTVVELENEKATMYNQSRELRLNLQESERLLTDRCKQQELEKDEFLSEIGNLKKELSCLSSCSLPRETEALRKELEKTKVKLKEAAEFKLKNAIQDKTKLEGEKAQAEREIKYLRSQKTLLERDICKRDSVDSRRRESRAFDSDKTKGAARLLEQPIQYEYKKLEVLAFEMETTIASLEEDLARTNKEKEEILHRNEVLTSDVEATYYRLSTKNFELEKLEQEVSSMRVRLAESEFSCENMESSIKSLSVEKEELAMLLTNALLELVEEKAIWVAKEKASFEFITKRVQISKSEFSLFSNNISEVKHELEFSREECKAIRERLELSEEKAEYESKCSIDKSSQISLLMQDLKISESEYEKCQDVLKLKYQMLEKARADVEELKTQLSSMEIKMHNDLVTNSNEKAKLKMRLRTTQAKLDAFKGRYKETMKEACFMNKKYEEGSGKLKEQLASYGVEVLHLKKKLAAMKG